MEEEVNGINASVMAEQLREAGTDVSKQVPALFKLGEWYLEKAKTNTNGADFTKADALYNAALVRTRIINHEIDEEQILKRIVETYQQFLYAFANESQISADKICNEIDFHKKFLVNERGKIKECVKNIDVRFNRQDATKDHYEVFEAGL